MLAVLAVLGAAWSWHSRRMRTQRLIQNLEQERVLQEERARIARDLHDDLGANLTCLALQADLARGQLPVNEPSGARLEALARDSRSLVDRLREVIWSVDPKCDTLDHFADYLCGRAEEFLHAAGLNCRLDVPRDLEPWPLAGETRHNLLLVVKEAVHNAVKHAGASEVRLSLRLAGNALEVTVEDDGHGGVPTQAREAAEPALTVTADSGGLAAKPHGYGLASMRRRVEDLGGAFEISHQAGQGTRVKLSVPLRQLQAV